MPAESWRIGDVTITKVVESESSGIGTHFGTPSGCHVQRDGSSYRLLPVG